MTMNPFSSRSISSGNQPVRGSAPMKTKRAAAGTVSVRPEMESLRTRRSRRPSPPPPMIRVLCRTSMFSAVSISFIR